MALKKKKPQLTVQQVLLAGELLISIPKLQVGLESPSKIEIYQTPDKFRYLIHYSDNIPEFMKISEMVDMITAYDEVVEYMEMGLSLIQGEDQKGTKH